MITKSTTHYYIEAPLPDELKQTRKSMRVNVYGIRVRVYTEYGLAKAQFRHSFNDGTVRRYNEGLELAVEAWLKNWGYADMSLADYLKKMFERPKRR